MSKNSIHAHLNQGKLWRDWLKKGGDREEMKKGKERMKRWEEEEAQEKLKKSLDKV